jgi:hypothetical protein
VRYRQSAAKLLAIGVPASRTGASLAVARGTLGDELRSRDILAGLSVGRVPAGDISRFRATFAPVLARELVVSPAPTWLRRGAALRWRRPLRTSCSAFRPDGARRYARWKVSSRSRLSTTRRHSQRYLPRLLDPRSCASFGGRAGAPTPTPRGRSGGSAQPRASSSVSGTGFPSSASSTSPCTRRSSRSTTRGGALACRAEIARRASARLRKVIRPLGHVATRPLRGRDDHVTARALRKHERGIGTHDECGRVVL